MGVPANAFEQVITYQESGLALLQNLNCFIGTANTKFKNFDEIKANLGSTVNLQLPTRFTTANSLVASFQEIEQREIALSVNQSANVAIAYTAEQFIFNAEQYMDEFGRSAIGELGAHIEADVAGVCETAPYRFYGDGVTPINSSGQLASALAFFRNYGAATYDTKGYLEDLSVANIINSNLNQFVPRRNEEEANSWELGMFDRCDWYQSNLLPIHTAGSEGVAGSTLTVVSTTLNADGAVTAITFSGCSAASDADSVKQYDSFQFSDGVSGQPNLRYLTFQGHKPSANPVQFQATADAASTGASQVTVSITPALQANAGKDQNINNAIVAGMQCTVLPTHRCGLITAGNPLFLAMPRLPSQEPFPTANKADPETGVSMRMYWGTKFGENVQAMVHDCLWDKICVPEYSMKIAFPV